MKKLKSIKKFIIQQDMIAILSLSTSTLELASLSNVRNIISRVKNIVIEVSVSRGFPQTAEWLAYEAKAQITERRHDHRLKTKSILHDYSCEVSVVEAMLRRGEAYPEWPYFHRGRINAFWNMLLLLNWKEHVKRFLHSCNGSKMRDLRYKRQILHLTGTFRHLLLAR